MESNEMNTAVGDYIYLIENLNDVLYGERKLQK